MSIRKSKLYIALLLIAIMIVIMVPPVSNAATRVTSCPTSITKSVNSSGNLTFKWSGVSGADTYKLTVKNITKGTTKSFTTTSTSYTLSKEQALPLLSHGCLFTASVSATDKTANFATSSARYLNKAITYVDPTQLYISHTSLKINKGKVRKLRVTYDSGVLDTYSYDNLLLGGWKSSNTSVATVSSAGNVTAKAAGTTKITYTSLDGLTKTCDVTVPSSTTAGGSIHIENGQYSSWHQLLGSLVMRKGSQNRLNGTVKSDYAMRKIYVKLYNPSGKRISTYSKITFAKSYNLTKISKNIKFSALPKGTCRVIVQVKNSKGTATLYSQKFKVTGNPYYSNKGKRIVERALTRQGDPYSQWLRGTSNYADCSYLTLWTYKQAVNANLPATAADQYKYCVKKGKKISKSKRAPGDLVFWGGKSNGRYKGIWHTAVYMGNNMICHANGSYTDVSTIQKDSRYPIYYGRPY